MIWWFDNPARSRQERDGLEKLAATVNWLVPRGWRIDKALHLIWDADIVWGDESFAFELRYPNHFPYSPPLVVPRDRSERWSAHQYASGELCLEHGADNWRSEFTGADMVQSAYRLLFAERTDQAAEVPSRHETTIGQDLRGKYTRFLFTRELDVVLKSLPEGCFWTADAAVFFHNESNVNVIAKIDRGELGTWQENLPEPLRGCYSRSVMIIRWQEQEELPSRTTLTAFRKDLDCCGIEMPSIRFVVFLQGADVHAYSVLEEEDQLYKVAVIPAQPKVRRVDEEHSRLADLRVAVVGCGSLGSKMATSLARAGVRQFLLVDHDILLPDNFVRHDLDWRDVGRHKVDAVASRIQMVNPEAECEKYRQDLGGQESGGSTEILIEALGRCALLVDATANSAAFNYLSAASVISKKPLLWAEIYSGGVGGSIARCRPGFEPDPQAVRGAIDHWWREQGTPMECPQGPYQGGPNIPAIADDSDVTVLAAHATRLAIDTLLAREPSMFPHSVYVIGLAKGLIFSQPLETYPITLDHIAIIAGTELDEAERKAEVDRLIELLKEYQNADSSGTAAG